jgi:phosphoribosylformylglycinamidine synthase
VVFASQLRGHLGDAVRRFLAAEKLVLGICNGFQVLLKTGIFETGADSLAVERNNADATLTWNLNGKYTARWVHLKVAAPQNVFLKGIKELDLPIAHAEGRIVVRDKQVLSDWASRGQIALTYSKWPSDNGTENPVNDRWAANPNGSTQDIAGLGDASGRVLGLMPHPERFPFGTQHPQWTRLGLTGDGDGRRIFQNAVDYFA